MGKINTQKEDINRYYNRSILLVDKHSNEQTKIIEMLKNLGLVVTIANDREQGMQALSVNDYSVLIIDMELPIIEGFGFLLHIRENGFKSLPVLAITEHHNECIQRLCVEAGVYDFVIKPITIDALVDELDNLLDYQDITDYEE